MSKNVDKMIKAYNKKAEKWGYQKIEVKDGVVVSDFEDREPIGSFFSKFITSYKNGYMYAEYGNIKDALKQ